MASSRPRPDRPRSRAVAVVVSSDMNVFTICERGSLASCYFGSSVFDLECERMGGELMSAVKTAAVRSARTILTSRAPV